MFNEEMQVKVLGSALWHVKGLLDDNWSDINRAMAEAVKEAAKSEDAKPLKYKIALSLTLTPRGTECDVAAGIRYNVRHADETEPITVTAGDTEKVSDDTETGSN